MGKMRLEVDALKVESFEPVSAAGGVGTVWGYVVFTDPAEPVEPDDGLSPGTRYVDSCKYATCGRTCDTVCTRCCDVPVPAEPYGY